MAAPIAIRGWRGAVVVLAAALTGIATATLYARDKPSKDDRRADAARLMNDLMSGEAAVGGPFTLTDQNGNRKSLDDFRGKIVLLYFGYTFCPDVCPTDMSAIGRLMTLLGADGDKLQPVFITLDPERDTQAVLRKYAAAFHPRFVALRGTEDEVRRVATAYKIYFEKVTPPGSSSYAIDHMAFIFLLDRKGKYIAFFPPGTTVERMATMVRDLLAQSNSSP